MNGAGQRRAQRTARRSTGRQRFVRVLHGGVRARDRHRRGEEHRTALRPARTRSLRRGERLGGELQDVHVFPLGQTGRPHRAQMLAVDVERMTVGRACATEQAVLHHRPTFQIT